MSEFFLCHFFEAVIVNLVEALSFQLTRNKKNWTTVNVLKVFFLNLFY
jgi:hypothetical protein